MTPGDVARFAGIKAPATVRRWEAGQTVPQIDVLRRALRAIAKEQRDRGISPVTAAMVIITEPSTRKLSDLRHLQLLTQGELAERVGLGGQSAVGYLELGEADLTPEVTARLAAGLAVSEDEVRAAHERARVRRPGTPA